MPDRLNLASRTGAALVMIALVTGCGGGGGGSSPSAPATTPPVTSVPAAGTILVPGQQSSGGGSGGFVNDGVNPSSYTVTSTPSGLTFTVGGSSYTTPAVVTPAASVNALAITFASGYSVPIVQVSDGPHKVYYNQTADSSGHLALASLQSIRRGTASSAARGRLTFNVHRTAHIAERRGSDVDPSRVAVRLSSAKLAASGRSAEDIERAVGSTGRATLSATADQLRVVLVPRGEDVATFTHQLLTQPEVAEVSPVHRRHTLARTPTMVTDTYFDTTSQWYTFAEGANYAWSYNPGTGTKIAVLDTGIDDNNTDLTGQLAYQETAVSPIDNSSPSSTCEPTANTVVTTGTAQDDNGHGTNVAGIALAKQDTVGFAGTAWGAQLMAFKIFPSQNIYCNDNNDGQGGNSNNTDATSNFGADTADEGRAIADAVAQGADVISLSIGSSSFDMTEFNAIESAIAAGVTVVAAAGNSDDGSGAGTLDYPGAYPGVISVGASALKDQYSATQQPQNNGTYATSTEYVTSYSQYGPSLAVVAPGGDASGCVGTSCDQDLLHWIANYSTSTAFLTTDQCSTPSPATSCVALFNGTSQATPQVSATAAMLIAEAGGHKHLTPAQVQYAIESTADNINDPHQGHGRLNSYRALASLIRDTAAYSGPSVTKTGTAQLTAFAYSTSNTNRPTIIDANYPAGIPVAADGSFRIADVPAGTGSFGVAVWYDQNGDGVVDAGDQIGTASVKCSSAAVCAIGTLTMSTVSAGYFLP